MKPAVLYIEDSPDDVLFVQRAFQKVAPTVQLHVIPSGEAAVNYFDPAAQPEPAPETLRLVLLDLNLPGRSGHYILGQIRRASRCPRVPVVIFSASNQQKDIDACYAEGCNAYLIKPTDSDGLRQMISLVTATWLKENLPPPTTPILPPPN
jgi:two-component system response regulator